MYIALALGLTLATVGLCQSAAWCQATTDSDVDAPAVTEADQRPGPIERVVKSYRNHYKKMYGELVTRDANGAVHVRTPMVQVDVAHDSAGKRKVHVESPLAQVDKGQPGSRKVKVDAPFFHAEKNGRAPAQFTAQTTPESTGNAKTKGSSPSVPAPRSARIPAQRPANLASAAQMLPPAAASSGASFVRFEQYVGTGEEGDSTPAAVPAQPVQRAVGALQFEPLQPGDEIVLAHERKFELRSDPNLETIDSSSNSDASFDANGDDTIVPLACEHRTALPLMPAATPAARPERPLLPYGLDVSAER